MTKEPALGARALSKGPGSALLIMSSLASGQKYGYAITKDIEAFAGIRIAPGTMYEALARLESLGLIEPVVTTDRRRPYRLTGAGATTLEEYVASQEKFVKVTRRRLQREWRPA